MTTKTDINTVFNEVVADNGTTWIGEIARKHNYKTPTLVNALMTHAQLNKLSMPVLNMVQTSTSTRNSFKSAVITRKVDSTISISPSRLAGTPLENATEVTFRTTEHGIELIASKIVTIGDNENN